MAKFDRLTVYNTMAGSGLVAVFYEADLDTAKKIVKAVFDGGGRLAEFTNRGDGALGVFTRLAEFAGTACPGLILGVGSIVDLPTAALYIDGGANFVVGPAFNPEVARMCNRRKIAYVPGCGTASEISAAEELGAEFVKIFPGKQVGGPAFVKALLGPMPWVRVMPTGGVEATEESVREWIKAGTACLGMGGNLVNPEWVKAGDFALVSALVRQVLAWIAQAKGTTR